MKSKYIIEEVVVVQISPTHIPYFGYAIIKGPKGGKTLLDFYNLEKIIHHRVPESRVMRIEEIIINYAIRNSLVRFVDNLNLSDGSLRNVANKLGVGALIRRQESPLYFRIESGLNVEDILRTIR